MFVGKFKKKTKVFAYTLCARIIKAKYYPQGDLLKGVLCHTQGEIVRGVQVLKNGMIWRVGNGDQFNTKSDPWILRLRGWTRILQTGNILNRVSDLFDPMTEDWQFGTMSCMDAFHTEVLAFLAGISRSLLSCFP